MRFLKVFLFILLLGMTISFSHNVSAQSVRAATMDYKARNSAKFQELLSKNTHVISTGGSNYGKIFSAFTSDSLNRGSWFAGVYNAIFNTINSIAAKTNYSTSASNVGNKCITILTVLMLFFILFTVMKAVISFTPIQPSKLLGDVFYPVGRGFFACLFIRYWRDFFSRVVSPILEIGLQFGIEMIKSASAGAVAYSASLGGGTSSYIIECTASGGNLADTALGKDVCSSLQSFLAAIAISLIEWMALGVTFIADSWGAGWLGILPSFKMIFVGMILSTFAFMLYVAFPIKFLDAMFRLMFAVTLFPLWCVFWVIPQTREYTKAAFNLLVNVIATFICGSVVLVMVLSILQYVFGDTSDVGVSAIVRLLDQKKTEQAMDKIGFSSGGLFVSSCLMFMAFHLVGKIDYFTNLFAKQESLGISSATGKAATTVIQSAPQAVRMGWNAGKWGTGLAAKGVGKAWGAAKEGLNRHRAKTYNESAPGGSARQSPRLWTAPIPGTGLWDAHKAKKAIGTYARTGDVAVSKVEKGKDGSTSQTYSNATKDKRGNVLSQMRETTSSNADKSRQSVERTTKHYNDEGDVRKTSNVKKDFKDGQAVRKTTTMQSKDGSRVDLLVDRTKGIASSVKFGADGKKISETVRDLKTGLRTVTDFAADGKKLAETVTDKNGVLKKTTFGANGQKAKMEERLANGRSTTTYDASGMASQKVSDFKQGDNTVHTETDLAQKTHNMIERDSDGNVVRSQVESRTGDGRKMQRTVDNETGIERTVSFDKADASGVEHVLASRETDSHTGNTTTRHYDPDSHQLQTEEVRARDGSSAVTTHRDDGKVERVVKDADGDERSRSWTDTDGSKQTTRYTKEKLPDGRFAGFETVDKDASGNVTRHFKVDLRSDTYTDVLTGTTEKWSDHIRRP